MKFTDSVLLDGAPRITSDGYMTASVRCARTGCQTYLRSELGLDGPGTVTVYRPESSVFNKDSLSTFAGKPVTINHPSVPVTAENWKDHAAGSVGSEIMRDGEFVRVPIVLMDAAAIKTVQENVAREISMGYESSIKFEDGVAPDGTLYQAVMDGGIRINHLAIVPRARGGDQLRIGDSANHWGASPLLNHEGGHDMADQLRTVIVDGLSVQTTDQGAQAIDKLTKQLGDAKADTQKLADAHSVALAAKDNEITKLQAALDDAKAKVLSDAQIDARVKERADLIATAKTIADADYSGKSDAEIRKAVVVAKFGDAAIAGKPEAYVQARFDLLVEDAAKQDPVRSHFQAQDSKPQQNINDNGQAAYEARLQNAWKTGGAK